MMDDRHVFFLIGALNTKVDRYLISHDNLQRRPFLSHHIHDPQMPRLRSNFPSGFIIIAYVRTYI